MTNKLTKYGIMIIAAVLLIGVVFAGAASATTTIKNAPDLQTALGTDNASVSGTVVTLLKNVQLTDELIIKTTILTLDLNGSTLTAAPNSRLFTVYSGKAFVLDDLSSAKTGKLTGGKNSSGAGVIVKGTFTMNGGNIADCTALDDNGGGVYVVGTFIMNGGNITGCTASKNGGGVYVRSGTFTMNGGNITGCTASKNGGGVYVNSGMLNVTGSAKIMDNIKSGKSNNVYLSTNTSLQLCGSFTGCISINKAGQDPTKNAKFGTATVGASGADHIFADANKWLVGSINPSNNNLEWIETSYVEVSNWDDLKSAVVSWTDTENPGTVVITQDIVNLIDTGYSGMSVTGNIIVKPADIGSSEIKLDANGNGRLFYVKTGGFLTLYGNGSTVLNLTGGNQSNGGTVSIKEGNLSLSSKVVIHNSKADTGGAIYATDAMISMSDSKITQCFAGNTGGAVYFKDSIFTMIGGSSIEDCWTAGATGGGGGVRGNGVTSIFTMSDSFMENCSVEAQQGGAVRIDGGVNFTMSNSTIRKCSATLGGGVMVSNSVFKMNGSTISNCTTTQTGGGGVMVSGSNGKFYMYNDSIIKDCTSGSDGGGGGVLINPGCYFELTNGSIVNCTAPNSHNGGGVYISGATFNMTGGKIEDCTATKYGGGIYVTGASSAFKFSGGNISQCTATLAGAGLHLNQGICEISGNATVTEDNEVTLNTGTYITVTSGFTAPYAGMKSISLNCTVAELPAFMGTKIVSGGTPVSSYFALSPTLTAYKYQLEAVGNDLVLGTNLQAGSIFVNISNADANPVTLILNNSNGENINTTVLSAGVTNVTFTGLASGTYSLDGYYTKSGAITGINKLVILPDNEFVSVDLIFPQQNVTTLVLADKEIGAKTPKVVIGGLDAIVADVPAPSEMNMTVITFTAIGETRDAGNVNQSILWSNITETSPDSEITYLNFTIMNMTVNVSNPTEIRSIEIISDVGAEKLLTIYIAYDMTNRENLQVWRAHDGTAQKFNELPLGTAPTDGYYTRDGNNGVYIYSQYFSEYALSSSLIEQPTPKKHSESKDMGSTVILTEPVTPTPTATPTATAVPTIATVKPTSQQTSKSPAPVFGVIAGLGAVAVLLRLRK